MPAPRAPNPNPPSAPPCIAESSPVVVGAGPAGSLISLLLHQRLTSARILERDNHETLPDVTRTYSQQVMMRGRRIVAVYPALAEAIKKRSIDTKIREAVISKPNGTSVVIRRAQGSPDGLADWRVLRSPVLEAMREVLDTDGLDVRYGCDVVDVQYGDDGWMEVVTRDGDRFRTRFLVACDGQWSAVAKSLLKATQAGAAVSSLHGFETTSYSSPSVGLTRKTVLIRKEYMESIQRDDMVEPQHTTMFLGDPKRPAKRVFNMFAYPVPDAVRDKLGGLISSIITYPGHALWDLSTVEDGFALFEENFPQIKVREAISEESMRLFVEARPSTYPRISRRKSLIAHIGKRWEGGVVLLGDAAHWGPPDLGQGMNAALEDGSVLANVLDSSPSDASIADMLDRYERERDADTTALVELARYAAPYQYGHSPWGSFWSGKKVQLRRWLAARVPGMHPAVASLLPLDLSYAEIREMGDSTTRKIVAVVATLVLVPIASIVVYRASRQS